MYASMVKTDSGDVCDVGFTPSERTILSASHVGYTIHSGLSEYVDSLSAFSLLRSGKIQ